jgi:hypothetical protein
MCCQCNDKATACFPVATNEAEAKDRRQAGERGTIVGECRRQPEGKERAGGSEGCERRGIEGADEQVDLPPEIIFGFLT